MLEELKTYRFPDSGGSLLHYCMIISHNSEFVGEVVRLNIGRANEDTRIKDFNGNNAMHLTIFSENVMVFKHFLNLDFHWDSENVDFLTCRQLMKSKNNTQLHNVFERSFW